MLSATRSPVRTARASALDLGEDGRRRRDRVALLDEHVDADGRVERAKDGRGDRDAADDARFLEQQLRAAAGVLGDERRGRAVAVADVLGERGRDDAVDRLLRQLHRSSTGSSPGRTTKCPASASSSAG